MMAGRDLLQQWHFNTAAWHGVRTPRMEVAARRWRKRAGDFSLDCAETPLSGFNARHLGQQRLRVRMVRAGENVL
jgi:hypothetical protein